MFQAFRSKYFNLNKAKCSLDRKIIQGSIYKVQVWFGLEMFGLGPSLLGCEAESGAGRRNTLVAKPAQKAAEWSNCLNKNAPNFGPDFPDF